MSPPEPPTLAACRLPFRRLQGLISEHFEDDPPLVFLDSAATEAARWAGGLRWLRDECGAVDDATDRSGNYAADVADMGGHAELAEWLRAECSGARARSLRVLGLPSGTTDAGAIRAAFVALARAHHRVAGRTPRARKRVGDSPGQCARSSICSGASRFRRS